MIYERLRVYTETRRFRFWPDRTRLLLELCRGDRVLHVGCTDAPITRQRLREGTLLHGTLTHRFADVIGIDISEEGLQLLREAGFNNVMHVDAERMSLVHFGEPFDAIVAGDVLEHLNNPGLFIECAKGLLRPGGVLIVGVPSALTINNLKTWANRGEYVHKDHCFYFSPKTLASLCGRYGFLPTELAFTVQPLTTGESPVFAAIRKMTLSCFKAMSPSFVMRFQDVNAVDMERWITWR